MSNLKVTAVLRTGESYYTTNAETGAKRPRFRYTVTGSPEAIAEYKRIKEAEGYYREDADGKPLFTSGVKKQSMSIELVDGIVIPKTADESIMVLESLFHSETDATIKAHLAAKIADAKIALAMRGTATASASAPASVGANVEATVEIEAEDEADL